MWGRFTQLQCGGGSKPCGHAGVKRVKLILGLRISQIKFQASVLRYLQIPVLGPIALWCGTVDLQS